MGDPSPPKSFTRSKRRLSPFRSPFRPYNRAYAYRGLTAFAPLSMAASVSLSLIMSGLLKFSVVITKSYEVKLQHVARSV
ncbi:MAG: hypothetical protein KZQ60_18715 [Candidatus Thiodiazotropha sp. (ex Lucinoma aequizonata)]|nr:hypothetical protein [Candidatus Thiodiazotropha sp. (ex Lucinoma aequizonata)]MCU7900258.1 hypothetical protein [Candidatus Thiodiazotropha sp. (ex Lucinoma aequizonata)]MCU7912444.1 hypothetical protein [Candidatus Thiodiazotropha sp. (ex Lucinoma aequizonata)]